jgi:hypothetical protein
MAGIVDFIELPFVRAKGTGPETIRVGLIDAAMRSPENPDQSWIWCTGEAEPSTVDLDYDALKKALMVRSVG